MRAQTRHQLKEDRFSRATIDAAGATVDWTVEHQNKLIVSAVVVALVIALAGGIWYYLNLQDQKASLEVSQAVRVLNTPVRPANMPAQPDFPSFGSIKERATEAQKKFQGVIDKYPHTHAAEVSRYFVGVTSSDLGDNAKAEDNLKAVISSGGADLSALAKMALAAVYRDSNKSTQAIDLYKQIIDKPTLSVPKVSAQMELAATYQASNQPLESKRIYEQIQKENPGGEVGRLAQAKLEALK
ncbi:MAG TPA: tetratricopeptide repeat protein [Terriglobales bacterium]